MLRHKDCGGVIKNRKCSKCGKTWGKVGNLFARDIIPTRETFDAQTYRQRIRQRKDIP